MCRGTDRERRSEGGGQRGKRRQRERIKERDDRWGEISEEAEGAGIQDADGGIN